MKVIFAILFCIASLTLFSQTVEVFGGASTNQFFGKNDDSYSYFTADYHSGTGYTAGIGLDSIYINRFRLRFSLQFDQYNGRFNAESNSGKAFYQKANGEIEKSVVSLAFFPFNFIIKKKVDLNFGAEVSCFLDETVSATGFYEFLLDEGPVNYDLAHYYDRYSSQVCYGLKGRIAYRLTLFDKIYLIPQYSYYYGLSSEFAYFPEATRSIRHYFCLGIKSK